MSWGQRSQLWCNSSLLDMGGSGQFYRLNTRFTENNKIDDSTKQRPKQKQQQNVSSSTDLVVGSRPGVI